MWSNNLFTIEISPCDGCNQQYKCDLDELACGAFSEFVIYGRFDRETVRIPTHKLFNKIFKEDDQALGRYIRSEKAKKQWENNELHRNHA